MGEELIRISVSEGSLTKFEGYEVTLDQLKDVITKKRWSPSLFHHNHRNLVNFKSSDLLVLDVDDGPLLEEAMICFKDYWHIIGTTKSHQKEKKGKICDRYRVILKLNFPTNCKDSLKATAQVWRGMADPAAMEAARFFEPCTEVVSFSFDGQLVELQRPAPKPERQQNLTSHDFKGDLSYHTLKFLSQGAVPGTWNTSLYKAAIDCHQNGYSEDEVIEMAERIEGFLDESSLKTIESAFNRDPTHEPRLSEGVSLVVTPMELLDSMCEYLEDQEKVRGTPTGIEGLDHLLGGGLRTGELVVLLAEAKTGKNSLFHQIQYQMLEKDVPIGYASREISPDTEVLPNLLSIATERNIWLRNGNEEEVKISEEEKKEFTEILSRWKLYFAEGYGYIDSREIKDWIQSLKEQKGVEIFFFDHLHYMLEDPEDFKAASSLIRELKALTKELDVCIVLIVQPTKSHPEQRLGLNSLRGGASIGQALDTLLVLERWKCATRNVTKLTLDVGRHKLAKPGHIFLLYDPSTTRLIEAEIVEEGSEEDAEPVQSKRLDLVR